MQFYGLINLSKDRESFRNLKMRIQFAHINMEQEEMTNELVYNALSHLAQVPELDIRLGRYENLRVPPNNRRLNVDSYAYARSKLKEAELLLEEYQ